MRRLALAALFALASACSPEPEPPAQPQAPTPPIGARAPDVAAAPQPAPESEPAPVETPEAAWERRLDALPPRAADVIRRAAACNRLSGEDLSARPDGEADLVMYGCQNIAEDTMALQRDYADRPDVLNALDMANRGIR
jgi:hypothetical protein